MWKVQVHVKEARHLPKMDQVGSCDGFVKLKLGAHQSSHTKVIAKSFNPRWNETFVLIGGGDHGNILNVEVYDQDIKKYRKAHEFVGGAHVDLDKFLNEHGGLELAKNLTEDKTVHLLSKEGEECIGDDDLPTEVEISITCLGIVEDHEHHLLPTLDGISPEPDPESSVPEDSSAHHLSPEQDNSLLSPTETVPRDNKDANQPATSGEIRHAGGDTPSASHDGGPDGAFTAASSSPRVPADPSSPHDGGATSDQPDGGQPAAPPTDDGARHDLFKHTLGIPFSAAAPGTPAAHAELSAHGGGGASLTDRKSVV